MKDIIKKIWIYFFIALILFGATVLINYQNTATTKKMEQELENFHKNAIFLQKDVENLRITIEKEIKRINKEHEEFLNHEHKQEH